MRLSFHSFHSFHSFPRSAWERRPRRSAALKFAHTRAIVRQWKVRDAERRESRSHAERGNEKNEKREKSALRIQECDEVAEFLKCHAFGQLLWHDGRLLR